MKPRLWWVILAVALSISGCAGSQSSPIATDFFDELFGKNALTRAIAADCMNVSVTHFKRQAGVSNPAVAAETYCESVVRVCRGDPFGEDCKEGARAIDRDRSESGESALFEASSRGGTRLVRDLLKCGFDPDAQLGGPGWTGWTPLMIATAENHDEIVRDLLDAGADPNAQNDLGRTSLMFASGYGNAAIVTLLVDKGADLNIVPRDETGWTALMAAAANGHSGVVGLLLERGADKSLGDKSGRSALALAEANRHSESARLLRDRAEVR